ncbi:MAG: glycosyltransferase family 9 protein [Candidatus Parcubacteria bacterium]|nr:glycosyltransferase family 9 protein [Candidatus Parcubacteria bacterium]
MKIRTLVKAPALINSGYSIHSRQILHALLSDPAFDIYLEPLNWGSCSWVIEENEKQLLRPLVEKFMQAKQSNQANWDLFIHVTIPNEWERLGKFNVGVTAGTETDRISPNWAQKCNEMDLVIVPSDHAKKSFDDTLVEWENQQTGEKGTLKVQTPVLVCNEGVDTSVFKKLMQEELSEPFKSLKFTADFNFLCCGQWGKGGYGEDRKNIANTIKWFIEAFRCRKDVGLVLKLNMARNHLLDEEMVSKRIEEIKANYDKDDVPPIHLVHGYLKPEEMASLYNHPQIKSFISLSNGESWGLPLLEAAACELPIISTNWGGQLSFLKRGYFSPIDYDMREIPESAVWEPILIKGSRWANVKESDAKHRMQKMVAQNFKPREWAKELAKDIKERFDEKATNQNFLIAVKQEMMKKVAAQLDPKEHLESFVDTPDDFNIIYTMPMSTGDVFISTAVIDGLKKQLPENAKIYFATQPKYFDLLKGNPHVYKCIPWNEGMLQTELLEEVFDLALTPNIATHYMFSNWLKKGYGGKILAEMYSEHCECDLGEYYVERDESALKNIPMLEPFVEQEDQVVAALVPYITVHTTSGKGQWEGRYYRSYQEVLDNVKQLYPELYVVQVGDADEPALKVDVDLRGKTNYQQLASVLEKSLLHLSPDTFTMHLASALKVPFVGLFGCSSAKHTRPWVKDLQKAKFFLLQSERLTGCKERACYKNRCKVSQDPAGPMNEILESDIFKACERLLRENEQ